ncbi:hypothetical protein [Antarcticirhabdus aurantiaca]|uniref:Uncharacterized protein n=1 Tax=Antarcticirhabdus aurantiaca TaxID=2606717 RepID=A0ACD4NIH2_9HYPH|nr:hypothetical protein [Antarcticirhabdus aurantiaca]WAJ26595.1 hypothetical protein OXU80_17145 [Jeongeuplla avenae]
MALLRLYARVWSAIERLPTRQREVEWWQALFIVASIATVAGLFLQETRLRGMDAALFGVAVILIFAAALGYLAAGLRGFAAIIFVTVMGWLALTVGGAALFVLAQLSS